MEGLVPEVVPVEEEAEDLLGRQWVEGWAAALVGPVCAGWSEEVPGWEVACKEEV